MDTLWQDIRYGCRMLTRSPGFAVIAVLTLALGIGANTAIFSVINTLLLQPLPYKDADRMVLLQETNTILGFDGSNVSYPNLNDWLERSQTLEAGVAFRTSDVNFAGGETPERLRGARISPTFFSFVGQQPLLGRTLLPEDRNIGAERVVMISEGLWKQNFGSNPDVIGQIVRLDSEGYTVVGVVPAIPGIPQIQVWRPLVLDEVVLRRNNHFLESWARLAPGVTIEEVRQELGVIAQQLAQEYPETNKGYAVSIRPLQEWLASENSLAIFFVLLGIVGLILLIGCANIANLLLSRAVVRKQEISIRTALGGGRLRLVQQLLTESLILGLIGGVVGLLLAVWGVQLLTTAIFEEGVLWQPVQIDTYVVTFTLLLSCLSSVMFGLIPAWQATKTDLNASLKESTGGHTGASRHRVRNSLMISEIALAVVLLSSAGLFLTAFYRLTQVDPGFDPTHMLSMRLELPQRAYPTNPQVVNFYEELQRQLVRTPGIESAAVVSSIPIGGSRLTRGYIREGDPVPPPGETRYALYLSATPDYFETMKAPILQGREFNAQDRASSVPVAVINETMAQQLWPDENPIGKMIRVHTDEDFPRMIVGVTGNVKSRISTRQMPQVFVPLSQNPWRFMSVVVRTQPNAAIGLTDFRRVVAEIDPNLPIYQFQTFAAVLDGSLSTQRNIVSMVGSFAAVALLLAAIGIYGVVASIVSQRTQEIGIRMALGANNQDVLRMVLRQGMVPTLIGLTIGLGGAFALAQVIASNLPVISTTEPLTFVTVCAILLIVALFACYIPARRATRIDPMHALRYE